MSAYIGLYLPLDVPPLRVAEAMAVVLGAQVEREPDGFSIKGNPMVRPNPQPSSLSPGEWRIDIGEAAYDAVVQRWGPEDQDIFFFSGPDIHAPVEFRAERWVNVDLPPNPVQMALALRLARWFGGFVELTGTLHDRCLELQRTCPVDIGGNFPVEGASLERYWEALARVESLWDSEVEAQRPIFRRRR